MILTLPAAEIPLLGIVPRIAAQNWVLTAGRTWPLLSVLRLLLQRAKATFLHAGNQVTHKAQNHIASMCCWMNCVMSTLAQALYIIHGFNRALSKVLVAPGGERHLRLPMNCSHQLLL